MLARAIFAQSFESVSSVRLITVLTGYLTTWKIKTTSKYKQSTFKFCSILKTVDFSNAQNMKFRWSLVILLFVLLTVNLSEGKAKKKSKQLALQSKETNVVNFVRLMIMRLVFGVASSMGLGENISGVLGGMFVPPGADYYDDYGGDDDYTGGLL